MGSRKCSCMYIEMYIPVGDDSGVDKSELSLQLLLLDGHWSNGRSELCTLQRENINVDFHIIVWAQLARVTTATKFWSDAITDHNTPSQYTTIMDDNKGRRIFSLGLLLLFAQSYHYVPLASGQQGKQYPDQVQVNKAA